MRILSVEELADCFDSGAALRYGFDAAWTAAGIRALARLGTLEYYADFPRPLFRVRDAEGLEIKGVEGEYSCRLLLPRARRAESRRRFESFFEVTVSPAGETEK